MIPELFQNDQGGFAVSLLISRIGLAVLYIAVAAVAAWILPRFVQRSVLAWAEMRSVGEMSQRRQDTIARMMVTLTRVAIAGVAVVAVLSLFVDSSGLFTFLGLFTAAMGFALRQTISDYISGFIFLFEDMFALGDDVQLGGERGTVEDVTMRTTWLRALTGEVRVVPNGDIRTVHNYTRAAFDQVCAQTCVPFAQFTVALEALDGLAVQLPGQIPALNGEPEVFVDDGLLGSCANITVRASALPGTTAEVQRQMMVAMHSTLVENDIEVGE